MERRTSTLALLCVVWSAVAGIKVDIPQDQYEFARGDNITLPCTFQSALSNPILAVVTWSIVGENVIITHYHPNGVTDIKTEYQGRVSVDANVNGGTGKADLKLSSITTADNKKYECQVQIPRDNVGKDADTATLTVLVAPSKPICKIEGTASYGQNVSLTCVSEEGSPPPTYKWNRYDVQNNPGAFPPKTTEKEGTLFLYNLTKETSGFYICTSANKIRSASCNLTVTVLPPSMMSIGSTAAIIGAGVAALILLIVIIYCCCCRKKDDDKENYAMAPVGDEESVRYGESRYGDGEKSKHFDDSSANKTAKPRDDYEERSERNYNRRSDYDDRRSDYDDRRSDYNDRRSDYDDRRSDYNDRRSDYDDRRSDYNDRRSDYNDSKPSDRNERYDDDRHYDDERRHNDRRDPRYDDDRNRP